MYIVTFYICTVMVTIWDILLKPPQPFTGLFFRFPFPTYHQVLLCYLF